MAANTSFILNDSSKQAFIEYYKQLNLLCNDSIRNQRTRFEKVDKAYQRENDTSDTKKQADLQNKAGNPNPVTNTAVPIVKPQVESAVQYQTSVFLTGIPIFGVVSNAKFMDEALQLETVIDVQATRGGWTKEFIKFFRNGAKYNFAPLEMSWEKERTVDLTTDIQFSPKEGKPVQTIWAGNKAKSLDPYNTFVDPRVHPTEVYKKGEFAGYTEFLSRIELKQEIAKMDDTQNVKEAFESARLGNPANNTVDTTERYYVPAINPEVYMDDKYDNDMNWLAWASLVQGNTDKNKAINYKNTYEKTTLYLKILPSEFGLKVPGANTPQIWKLIIINHSVIIYAERQTNAHGWIPIFIGMPNDDDLGYQTKSLADDAIPFQNLTTAFMSSILASRRRAISDRTLYDPSRVLAAHINSDNPAAKIPVRPAAYGKNISDAVYAFPYREDQGAFSIQHIRELISMSNSLAMQNPAKQGQFVKGNKTKKEFSDVMANANGSDQVTSIVYEAQVFMPLKQLLKLNILQYQGAATEYSREQEKEVDVDPVALRKAVLEFKISDGLTPSDKLINADSWKVALQVLGSSPQLAAPYRMGEMVSYLMKTQGANIKQFEKSPEQVAYEQAVAQWQQIAMTVAEKGGDMKTVPPQPKPADYGYDPSGKQAQQQQSPVPTIPTPETL